MEAAAGRAHIAAGFNTTHWTIVLACRNQDDAADQALAELYQIYWYPLYAYIRRRGYSEHDAEDIVQGFYAQIREKHSLAKADPQRGKFRTFLLSSLQNFLAKENERSRAQKRGGGRELIRLDAEDAKARYQLEPAHSVTPERIFEMRWAHALLEQTLSGLRADFAARGKQRIFEGLQTFLTADCGETSYQQAADNLGLPLSAVKTSVHRMRLDYRARLREEIGRTVSCPEEIEDELLYLRRVLADTDG